MAAAILNSVYRPLLACYCIYLHEIWQMDSLYGPTYGCTITLNNMKYKMAAAVILNFCINIDNLAAV